MNRTDRLTGITLALQSGPRTAAALAERFEVSRRTILRDIDVLSQLGVPVIAVSGPNGGYRLPDDYWLPPLHLSAEEATVLLFALAHLGQEDDSPLGTARATAEQKIRASLRPGVAAQSTEHLSHLTVAPADMMPDAEMVAAIRTGVAEERWIDVEYQSLRGVSRRAILPRKVYVADGRWYTSAVDSLSAEVRVFRVDRISALTRILPPPDAEEIVATATGGATPYDDASHPEVRVELTARGLRRARDEPDLRQHLSEVGTAQPVLVFRCPPTELPYYARVLMRFGADATILAPTSLRTMVVTAARALLDHHQGVGKAANQ